MAPSTISNPDGMHLGEREANQSHLRLGELCGAAHDLGVGVRSAESWTGLCWVTVDRKMLLILDVTCKTRVLWGGCFKPPAGAGRRECRRTAACGVRLRGGFPAAFELLYHHLEKV